jgi:peptide/nickel transport system substrate-binding protein
MAIRMTLLWAAASAFALVGCKDPQSGPIAVSAIGSPPELRNPNLEPLDPSSEALLLATAQGLVRLDAAGQIEPALAQSWIVSDDGLRYTFRLSRTEWHGGGKVTAEQVADRLRAAFSPVSRNPVKPLLGAVEEVVAMTDDVLEISLVSPRPNFLQLLAQPEMAMLHRSKGTGPFHAVEEPGHLALHLPPGEEEDGEETREEDHETGLLLRGEGAALAVARFKQGGADLVTGGTAGNLPVARAAGPAADALRFDPAMGLFGLSFGSREGITGLGPVRRALSMAIDRAALVAAIGVPDLQPRETLLPPGIGSCPSLPGRNGQRRLCRCAGCLPPRPLLRRAVVSRSLSGSQCRTAPATASSSPICADWRAIGVTAERVAAGDRRADLHLIDRVAPADLASWYLRQFSCRASAVCDFSADETMDLARRAATAPERQALLAQADRSLAELTPFIPLTAPVRWSLVSPRLTGFRPNVFGRHNIAELIAARR